MLTVGLVGPPETEGKYRQLLDTLPNIAMLEATRQAEKPAIPEPQKHFFSISEDDLLVQSDALIISGTGLWQYGLATKALRLAKHVYFDDFVSLRTEKLKEILKLACEANVYAVMQQSKRNHPAILAAMNYVHRPQFIDLQVFLPSLACPVEEGGWIKLLAREIDLLNFLTQTTVKKISANGIPIFNERNDLLNLRLEYSNGCAAHLIIHALHGKACEALTIYQKEATIQIDLLAPEVTVTTKTGEWKPDPVANRSDENELLGFLNTISHGEQPYPANDDFSAPLQLAHQALEKMRHKSLLA
jgi:predicted dehydrogenase